MGKFKAVTHVLAGAALAVVGFFASPAGQAVVHQYPWLTGTSAGVLAIAAVYHNPNQQ